MPRFYYKKAYNSLSDLNYLARSPRPITSLLMAILDVPPERILVELKTKLQNIDNTLREALRTKGTQSLKQRYLKIQSEMRKLYQRVVSSIAGEISLASYNVEVLRKLAAIDVEKYNKIVVVVNELLEQSRTLDLMITTLASEIVSSASTVPDNLPPSDFFSDAPSLEKQELQEEKQTTTFPPVFSNFAQKMGTLNNEEFETYKNDLVPKIQQSIQQKLDADQTLTSKDKLFLNPKTVGMNLDRLRALFVTGSINGTVSTKTAPDPVDAGSFESSNYQERYEKLLTEIIPFANVTNFEEALINNPELLAKIVIKQSIYERYATTKKKDIPFSTLQKEDEGKSREITPEFRDYVSDPTLVSFMSQHGVDSPEDIVKLAKQTDREFFSEEIVPDIIANPKLYANLRIDPSILSPEELRAISMNNAAINYSLYQLHGQHFTMTQIIAKLRESQQQLKLMYNQMKRGLITQEEYEKHEQYYQQIPAEAKTELIKVLKMCFPLAIVQMARNTITPDDKMLLEDEITKPLWIDPNTNKRYILNETGDGPRLFNGVPVEEATPYLFNKIPDESQYGSEWYPAMLNMMADKLVASTRQGKKHISYFSFGGWQIVGYLLSYAYGGYYKPTSVMAEKRAKGSYRNVVAKNPNYFKKKIQFESMTTYDTPDLWGGKEKEQQVSAMTDMTNHIKMLIDPKDDQTSLYAAYMNASIEKTLQNRIGEIPDYNDMFEGWRNEYYKMTGRGKFSYRYPLVKYLYG